MKKSPQPPLVQKTLMAAIGKGIRVVQSSAALALTGLFAMTHMAGAQTTFGPINVAGVMLCTNTDMTCTISSATGTITNVSLSYTTTLLGGGDANSVTTNVNSFTAGLNTATATFTYPLVTNVIYTALSITALDNSGASASTNSVTGDVNTAGAGNAPEAFDTLEPALVIEGEDYNFTNGGYMNTPPDGGLALYVNEVGIDNIDFFWIASTGPAIGYYRAIDEAGGLGPQSEFTDNNWALQPQKFWTAAANGDTTDVPIEIGYNSTGNWFDYTRDFGSAPTNSAPAGTYGLWAFCSSDDTGTAFNVSLVTSDTTTSNQTTSAQIGVCTYTDANWNNYYYEPITDHFGNPVGVALSGHETLRVTVSSQLNLDFLMLTPATAQLTPALAYLYPDGLNAFELTNTFAFTVGAAQGAGIPESGITLILNGQNVTSGLTLAGNTNSWNGSFAITSNSIYTGTLTVVNSAGLSSIYTLSFDTFDVNNFIWEADDYDFSTNNGTQSPAATPGETNAGWTSGLFIDNSIPTADVTASATGHERTNSYFGYPGGFIAALDNGTNGAQAQEGVDFLVNSLQPYGSGSDYYRNDGQGSQPATDTLRPKFIAAQTLLSDPNIGLFNIGWTSAGDWQNFSRHYPSGKFIIYGRISGGNGAWSGSAMSMVTAGVGTDISTQTLVPIGTFADAAPQGWQSYHWIPCVDGNGVPVSVALGGLQTLQFEGNGNINEEFFMLVPFEPPTVPVLVSAYPDGTQPFQETNTFSFEITSASGAAIAQSGIGLVLNGVSVTSELTLDNSTTNWTGSIPLQANTSYTAVLSVTNGSGSISTFYKTFDTFNINNYTWEANDYDYNNGQFIDNPQPTGDTAATGLGTVEANSYFGSPGNSGFEAVTNVDFVVQSPQTIDGANDWYRADGQGSSPSGDFVRPEFIAARTAIGISTIGPYQMGYTSTGDWENYTRHYPAGTFNVFGRLAGNSAWSGTLLSQVTSGVGTMNQVSNVLGSFADPNAAGWEAFHWIPLLDTNGNMVTVTFTGTKTTLNLHCGGGINEGYYMLVPAVAQINPRIGPPSVVGGQLSIGIPTLTGHNYQVVFSSVLTPHVSTWTDSGSPIVGDGTVHTVALPISGAEGYYAIKVQ